jgi:branched-chain amino acid transport system permease protein
MKTKSWIYVVVGMAAAALPFAIPGASTFQLTQMIGIAIALIGLNVFVGWVGQPSLAQGAMFALGAYVTAMLCGIGVPWWLALTASALTVAAFAWLLSVPLLRLSHSYLALSTFAFALAIPQVLRHGSLSPWTGGATGLQLERPVAPSWMPSAVGSDAWMYWVALAIAIVLTAGLAKAFAGRSGLELRAVRDNATAAAALGVNVGRVKSLAFAFSGMCAALGGGLYALNVQYVSPDSFGVFLSLTMLAALVVGGPASTVGPWIGAAFILYVPAWAERISTAAPWAIFGFSVLLIVFVAPRGLAGAGQALAQRLRQKAGAAASSGPKHERHSSYLPTTKET